MRITLLAIGKKMPHWVDAGYAEYARRFKGGLKLELREVPQVKGGSASVIREKEGQRLVQSLPRNNRLVALDVQGQPWSTAELAEQLARWKAGGQDVCLLVGGPEGLSPECLALCSQSWSLSALTLPHPLVRIVVAEQLYRAESVLHGHPYHRG